MTTKTCPYCAETVLEKALKCKHCGEVLDDKLARERSVVGQSAPIGYAIASFFFPGLGQLLQYRPLDGFVWFFLTVGGYMFLILPGVILHILCVVDALTYRPRNRRPRATS